MPTSNFVLSIKKENCRPRCDRGHIGGSKLAQQVSQIWPKRTACQVICVSLHSRCDNMSYWGNHLTLCYQTEMQEPLGRQELEMDLDWNHLTPSRDSSTFASKRFRDAGKTRSHTVVPWAWTLTRKLRVKYKEKLQWSSKRKHPSYDSVGRMVPPGVHSLKGVKHGDPQVKRHDWCGPVEVETGQTCHQT